MVGAILAAAPYAIAGVQSLGQLVSGAMKKNQANKMALPETDPSQIAMLDEINRKRKQLEMGVGAEYDVLNKQVGQNLGQTQANVLKAGGGDVGATMQGMNIAQQNAGNLYQQGSMPLIQKSGQYQMLAKQMVDDIAKRKFEVQQWQKLQKMREGAEKTQGGMQNLYPAMFGMINQLPTGTPTQTKPTQTGASASSGLMSILNPSGNINELSPFMKNWQSKINNVPSLM